MYSWSIDAHVSGKYWSADLVTSDLAGLNPRNCHHQRWIQRSRTHVPPSQWPYVSNESLTWQKETHYCLKKDDFKLLTVFRKILSTEKSVVRHVKKLLRKPAWSVLMGAKISQNVHWVIRYARPFRKEAAAVRIPNESHTGQLCQHSKARNNASGFCYRWVVAQCHRRVREAWTLFFTIRGVIPSCIMT